ncbi:hypothetical protein BJ508DRAFT_360127 [Ascobolus immersus RN42]|uniref:Uncharacterized protein n=1 Tax=Ascobolus immersus RN42 TaxID=1160509 RepID=A0A3N4IHX1_ASCIM|nr:hypothetical protein BJ508DRAFT_360127 [Ascobolus immersus RN42]
MAPPKEINNPPPELLASFQKAKADLKKRERTDASVQKKERARQRTEFNLSHGLLVGFLLWILALHVSGLYLFTRGFLLTRLVLENKSSCDVIPGGARVGVDGTVDADGCWYPKRFEKAVVVVIDALRYDFTQPYNGSDAAHFHNAFKVPYETTLSHPENSVLLPFIADPPTTTLQRLKGLTTGTLPTFIDAGSNFAGTSIEEDNLLSQWKAQGKRMAFLGDDTWMALFPDMFEPEMCKPYDSLNVWDLHTVDNGVNEYIYSYLQEPEWRGKWDVLVAHYLGVDHAGHRYGPDHPAMGAKLRQMDETVERIMGVIDEETLLVVMGDHGMDTKGDHGGESWPELEAAVWLYSKKPRFGRLEEGLLTEKDRSEGRSVQQIDLVPTLSLLLGGPVPFNNLGGPIAEVFLGGEGEEGIKRLAEVSRITAHQIKGYQEGYAHAKHTHVDGATEAAALFEEGEKVWEEIVKDRKGATKAAYEKAYKLFQGFQEKNLKTCRDLWARFDLVSMAYGIVVLIGSVIVLITFARGFDGDMKELWGFLLQKSVTGMAFGVAAGSIVSSTVPFGLSRPNTSIFCAALGSIFGFFGGSWTARKRLSVAIPDGWGWFAIVATTIHSVLFASNSFVVWEDSILTYLLSTFGLVALIASRRVEDDVQRALGTYQSIIFIILSRASSLSKLCREEQMPFCKSTFYASASSSVSSPLALALLFLTAITLPFIISAFFKGTKSYTGPAQFWIGWIFRATLLLSALYWFLDSADNGSWIDEFSSGELKAPKTFLAQLILTMSLSAATIGFAWSSVCLSLEVVKIPDLVSPDTPSTPTPAIPALKNDGSIRTTPTGETIVLYGYANIHGSRYALLPLALFPALLLLQKPMGGIALSALLWQIFVLADLVDILGLRDSLVGPVVLGLMGNSYFFATGHQATLQSIQWESAFIPLSTITYPWSPLLVIGNTLAPQILVALGVPLLVLWKSSPKDVGLLGLIAKGAAAFMAYQGVVTTMSTICAGMLRRHLMLYRIFCPRFMLGGVVLCVSEVVVVLVAVGGVRWGWGSVGEGFGWVF